MKRALTLFVLTSAAVGACKREPEKQPEPPPVPVAVAPAEQRDMPIELRAVGNVEAVASVILRPQVSGIVSEVPGGEGRDVAAGDPVVLIDARPFEAALREAEATLVRDQALAADQQKNAQALRAAAAGRAVSAREAEQAEAQAAAATAQAGVDQAAIETAKLNLSYCTITAPFAGRLGALLVKPGTVVKVNETDLISLTTIDPVDVSFTVREQDLASVRAAGLSSGITACVSVPGEAAPLMGEVSFIDSRVDPATGTVRMKAHFSNDPPRLWPGAFVNIIITTGIDRQAVVTPAAAVQASQRGQSVFVVKEDSTVDLRPVKVSRTVDGWSIITSGISTGERVVTDGQLRLGPGARVVLKDSKPAPAANKGTGNETTESAAPAGTAAPSAREAAAPGGGGR